MGRLRLALFRRGWKMFEEYLNSPFYFSVDASLQYISNAVNNDAHTDESHYTGKVAFGI